MGSKARAIQGAVLIIDGVDSVSIAHALKPVEYDATYITPLQACYRSVLASIKVATQDRVDEVQALPEFPTYVLGRTVFANWQGDELVVVLSSGDVWNDAESACRLAVETIMRWFLRPTNRERFKLGMPPFRLSAGVHCGAITLDDRLSGGDQPYLRPEGLALGFAKRLQSEAGNGDAMLICATEAITLLLEEVEARRRTQGLPSHWHFGSPKTRQLKGLGPVIVRELMWFAAPSEIWSPIPLVEYFEILMQFPFQPSLACRVAGALEREGDPEKATALRERVLRFTDGLFLCGGSI